MRHCFCTALLVLAGCETVLDEPLPTRTPDPAAVHALTRDLPLLDAERVVLGEVVDIDYAISEDGGRGEIPHTFVTWALERDLKGRGEATLTLRFVGGPLEDGRILMAEGVPLFNVGERDLLFIQGNESSICPLVDCEGGLIRLVDGDAFTAGGAMLSIAEDETLREGAVARHPALHTFQIRDDEFTRQPSGLLLDAPLDDASTDEASLVSWFDARLDAACTPEHLAALSPVRSADPAIPFIVR